MLQNQYFNSKLTKNHIEKILANYNTKYNTMKNEIDAKFNNLIKLFINDIKAFLENIEEISNERKKIKEAENREMEFIILKNKLEEKNKIENQLRNELELLSKENLNLKKKIKFKDQIIKNKNLTFERNTNNIRLKTETNPNKNRFTQITDNAKNKTDRKEKTSGIYMSLSVKTEEKKSIKNNTHRNQLSSKLGINNDSENFKYASVFIKSKKKANKSMDKRTINKNKIQQKIKSNLLPEKSPEIKSNQETKSSSNVQNLKIKGVINDEKFETVEVPFTDNNHSYLENESITTDEIIDEEIKELQQEEENIILLMDKIKLLNSNT